MQVNVVDEDVDEVEGFEPDGRGAEEDGEEEGEGEEGEDVHAGKYIVYVCVACDVDEV